MLGAEPEGTERGSCRGFYSAVPQPARKGPIWRLRWAWWVRKGKHVASFSLFSPLHAQKSPEGWLSFHPSFLFWPWEELWDLIWLLSKYLQARQVRQGPKSPWAFFRRTKVLLGAASPPCFRTTLWGWEAWSGTDSQSWCCLSRRFMEGKSFHGEVSAVKDDPVSWTGRRLDRGEDMGPRWVWA